jgi:hypothetical protein
MGPMWLLEWCGTMSSPPALVLERGELQWVADQRDASKLYYFIFLLNFFFARLYLFFISFYLLFPFFNLSSI